MGLCLSVRPSVRHKSVFYRNGWTNRAGFWHVSFLPHVLLCVKRKFGYLQNKGTSLWNFVRKSRLRKFRHSISIVETCYQLSWRKVDAQSVINWASELRRSTTIVYRTDRQALSTARFCRTGQLATADTWFGTCRTSSFCIVAWQLTRRIARSLGDSWASCLRYDTIRDAILTCARKPTWVSLIYRTEPTTIKRKKRKQKKEKKTECAQK